ncbi:MAG: response regulator [Cyanobacteria bacterium P01_C01_bin.118]
MRAEIAPPNVLISGLDKRIQYARQEQLTGILAINTDLTHQWRLYFLAGQLVWANTRTHAKRRWYRQLLKYQPDLLNQGLSIRPTDWTYNRLARLVICKKFNRQVFSDIVSGCIAEVLFDLLQQATLSWEETGKGLSYRIKLQKACDFSCINVHNVGIWHQVKRQWRDWQESELTHVCPNDTLTVKQLALLEDTASPRLLKLLSALADGHQTLRDMALKTKQPLKAFARSVLPHIQNQALQLKSVDDKLTKSVVAPQDDIIFKLTQVIIPKDARIVYVSDNRADSRKMATIIEAAGYRYSNVFDPLEVLKQLDKLKPKMIFLSLSMPVVNGYELCAQIRRMSGFKDIPIAMVADGYNLPERMRGKMVGASEFLNKPIKPKNVLRTLIELQMI